MRKKSFESTAKPSKEAAVKTALLETINKAVGLKRTAKGPEPERLKITGVKNWEDAVGIAMQKKKPKGGWPKR